MMSARAPDPDALRYAVHWEPVLSGPSLRLLDRLPDAPSAFLDIGAGTGTLVLAAAARWPRAHIVGLDASAGMLSVARQRVADGRPDEVERFEWYAADAATMPLTDRSIDVAASSFVMQLVSDRAAVLREVRRVLRPGGSFGYVAWLAGEPSLPADVVFDDVVADLGLATDGAEAEAWPEHDIPSLAEAREGLAAAGFVDIEVRLDEIRHTWTPDGFMAFKEQFADRDVFEALDGSDRERLRATLYERWANLTGDAFELRGALVSAIAQRPRR